MPDLRLAAQLIPFYGRASPVVCAVSRGRKHRTGETSAPSEKGLQRLQKVLASAGVASRRQCEQLILEGRVEVDRQPVTQLGAKVDPGLHEIRVDGQSLRSRQRVWYAVHKVQGVVSTSRDPEGRLRITDLVPPSAGRLFCVGRLDRSSEGLALLTNDGDLAHALTHPRYGIVKTYQVEVAGHLDRHVIARLKRGVKLAEGFARPHDLRIVRRRRMSTLLRMELREGRNREIRRMLARVDHKVLRLIRTAIGPVRLGDLPPGAYRPLRADEIRALRAAAAGESLVPAQRRGRKRTSR